MITKGSKIQLVKPMGVFDNIGEVCEVVNVTEDGVISFKFGNGMHLGCMSYDEFERYFVHYEEKKEKKVPKRIWSEWEYDELPYADLGANSYDIPIKSRTNGKIVEIRTDWEDKPNIKAKASCSKNDKFDFDTGFDIADGRLQIKLLQKELQDMIDEL